MVCSRRLTKEEAIDEFAHLTRLDHSHIVRVIGTYTFGRELSILMYPVAEYNLEDVLHKFAFNAKEKKRKDMVENMANSALGYFACLSNALDHIHHKLIKHMDIKPQNILVRAIIAPSRELRTREYKVYLTDFGSSRSYQNPEDVETDRLTSFTRKYAAPEVVRRELHGFPADVFSLGCVFLEILAYLYDYFGKDTILTSARSDIKEILTTNADGSSTYCANTARLEQYLISNGWTMFFRQHTSLFRSLPPDMVLLIQQMLSHDPKLRPTAKKLVAQFGLSLCCISGRETLKAMSNEQQDTMPEAVVVVNPIDLAEAGAWSQSYYGSGYPV
jgi:serine/threonine protein kinase